MEGIIPNKCPIKYLYRTYLIENFLAGARLHNADVGGLDEDGDYFGDALRQRVEHHDRRLATLNIR